VATSKTGDNDKGWWQDEDGEIVDPPYLTPEPGQDGECIHDYLSSVRGYASGAYPDGTPVRID
jgi:hypothetical protein